ncbi:Uncharacterised protein [Mycobacteroides abscessus subsp. abscessus]|uniref:Uncharacterized protein n=1 Tax=Mycobacteroides abscessus subsp. abscessus TaxID=1185650 RepID=A0AB38D2U3_9MYCO|nr:hypothetical protein [Mycobacteroides abscessus]SHP54326.1 Uncharacterised protein [Mycobacteroides abscessus subsp. abscessus]MBE5455755.1 hypothetical protein [Mycobacteroides abscessus]CPR93803.1 Uncharacterised protein [Mycobacteroides abscessus]CPS18371.1 Uncharacterised protein [Mycobacteroides abscessus]
MGDGGEQMPCRGGCCHHPGSDWLCDDCGEGHMSTWSCPCDCHPRHHGHPELEDFVGPGESSCRYAH